jgi:uncharacterized RDD family membrane protein YckC
VSEVVTGEAVVLDVPVARFPSRMAAVFIDMLVQILLLIGVVSAIFGAAGDLDGATAAGIFVTCYVAIVVGYSTIFETLSRGKTLGKLALGLRVISDDGGPVRFRQALVRGLTGAIEIWSVIGAPIGLITSIVSAQGKRLGDMFAGTYVIQERMPYRPGLPPMFAAVPPPLLGWAQVAEISRLSDQTADAAGSYLRRFQELTPAARDDLGRRIAHAVTTQVSPPPPPGTPPAAYLAAVLAVRRHREQARLATATAPVPAPPASAWTHPAAPPSPQPTQLQPTQLQPTQLQPAPPPQAHPQPQPQQPQPQPGYGGFAPPS